MNGPIRVLFTARLIFSRINGPIVYTRKSYLCRFKKKMAKENPSPSSDDN